MKTPSRTRGSVRTKPGRARTKRVGNLAQDRVTTPSYLVREQLENLLKNKGLPASARVTAARTLAEMDGFVGRHQAAPEKGTTTPLSALSRDQLTDELTRLRTLFDLGLVS